MKKTTLFTLVFLTIACSNEYILYKKAIRNNTYELYNNFLLKFPKSHRSAYIKQLRLQKDSIEILISTFLGNSTRNFYGDSLPDRLDTIWSFYLGEGLSPAYGYNKIWKGAGWTGQPALVREKNNLYLLQPAFDYGLHKIDANTGTEIWCYKFDDILKASPTICIDPNVSEIENRYIVLQGSRKGWDKDKNSDFCWSFRAISYTTGKEIWRMNSVATDSYSRDVDASALVIDDTGYIALENALFTVFSPFSRNTNLFQNFRIPNIYKQIQYYTQQDIVAHGDDLVAEASPTYYNGRIFTPSGTGWIYGYNIKLGQNDWELYIGADINGTMPLTSDNCLLVPIEKQYIKGNGGVMKINPNKPPQKAVEWFLPTDTIKWSHWEGGIIGSVTINDKTKAPNTPYIATFIDCKGYLYIIDYIKTRNDTLVLGPDSISLYKTPIIYAKIKLKPTIATPIIVQNRILAPCDGGLYLFEYNFVNEKFQIKLLDKIENIAIDATPICWNGRVYIADFAGYLWCFGHKKSN